MAILNPRRPHPARSRLVIALASAWLFAGAPALRAATLEYQVKAVYLFKLARYVEWPVAAFADAQAPFVIGVLGDDPFDTALDEVVRGENVNSRPLVVRRFSRAEDIADCQILFISRSEAPRLAEIIARLRGRKILTVGDAEGFARAGCMIRFVIENNKVRLKVNLEVAEAANLTISSKLLRTAEIVGGGKN
jgi:hypothetical protein